MNFKVGDFVTRNSYNNDIVFKITEILNDLCMLKGINVRLCADAVSGDLKKYDGSDTESLDEDDALIENVKGSFNFDRDEYFYLPGRILHIDGDQDYLARCLRFYENSRVQAYGLFINEDEMPEKIVKHLMEIKPDILVITGHDAYYQKKGEKNVISSYKNSSNFLKAINEARKYEKAQDKLIIIAGACQSDYEDLIKAGANFASSPKRINIHALDPAIIALAISLSNKNKEIDLLGMLEKTKYGKAGMGGVITKGTMYIGYPR